jgi:hypothetical protein
MKQIKSLFPAVSTWLSKDNIIKEQVKKDKNIVYGAQSIKKHIGIFARPTQDWDIYSKTPRRSAIKLERNLDRRSGEDIYYLTSSKFHKGTYKIYHKGADKRKGTADDIGVADFSKLKRIKTTVKNGIRYSELSESIKDKKKALKDPQYAFRHQKDREDLNRIRTFKKIRRYLL